MSKAKRKRPEDDAGVGTRASTRNRGGTAGGASATRPDGGADGGANFHAGGVGTNSAAGASARSRNRGAPRAPAPEPKGRKQRERTWRDLSQNALYDIVRRLDGPRAAKTKRRDLIARLDACVAELVACANKLIEVAARIEEHLAHAASTNPSFRIERDALREGMARLEALARAHVRRHARDDPRTLSSDKIVRAKINAELVAASLPILAAFLRDSVCEACPRATIAACDAFEALRVEVQLRTSVRVYREMPALRKTLYDGSVTKELAAELVTRIFGEIEKPNEHERDGDDDGGDAGGWVDGSSRIAPPPFVVNALFSACDATHTESSVYFANQTLCMSTATPRGGEDEAESSEAARTWAALWGETDDVAPAEGSGRGERRRSARVGTGTGPPEAAAAGLRRSARIAARPTSRATIFTPEMMTDLDGDGTSPGNLPAGDGRTGFRAYQPPARRNAVNLSHDLGRDLPRGQSRGGSVFSRRYPESLGPAAAPWTLVNVHGDEEETTHSDALEQSHSDAETYLSDGEFSVGSREGEYPQYRSDEDRTDDNRSDGAEGRTALPSALEVERRQRARLHDLTQVPPSTLRAHGLAPMEHDLTPPDVAANPHHHSRRPFGGFGRDRPSQPVGLSWDSELSRLFGDFGAAASGEGAPSEGARPPTRRGGAPTGREPSSRGRGRNRGTRIEDFDADESAGVDGDEVPPLAAVAKAEAMRTSVQLLARLVKYELFRRDPIPSASMGPKARARGGEGSGLGSGSRSPPAQNQNLHPLGGRSPLVPTFSSSGLKMLEFLPARDDPAQGAEFTVLDLVRPHLARDGRAAVLLACGCELFAARDALRMCPFEACAGVYACAAARVLGEVVGEWHERGPPGRNAADGWIAVTKLAETIAESCVPAGRGGRSGPVFGQLHPVLGAPGRPPVPNAGRVGFNPNPASFPNLEPGRDGAAASTSAAGFLAGIAGPTGENLGRALPALMSALVASRPPQRVVDSLAESTNLLARAVTHPPPPQFGSDVFVKHRRRGAGSASEEPSSLADDVGRAMRASAVDAIRRALEDVEVWARDGVVAHLKRPASGRAVADDCSAVARLVCAAATVAEIDATRISAARLAFAKRKGLGARPEMRTLANAIKGGVSGRELDAECRDLIRSVRRVVSIWPGMGDPSAFEPLEDAVVALPNDAVVVGDRWVLPTLGGSSPRDLCGLTPAARAMRATLEAIEAAVDAVVASAWLSSAADRRGGRGSYRGDGSTGGLDDDDATTRENDALKSAFSGGAVGAPFKTLVVAAGAVAAAAGILRGDAMNFCTDELSDKLSERAPEFADVAREMSLLVERFAPTLSRLVNAEPTAVTPGSPLAFLAERHPNCVPFAAKFKLLQREIRASLGGARGSLFHRSFDLEISRSDPAGGFYDIVDRIRARVAARRRRREPAPPGRVRAGGGLGLMRAGPGPGPGADSDSLDRRIDQQIAAAAEFRAEFRERYAAQEPSRVQMTQMRQMTQLTQVMGRVHRGAARGLFPAEVPWVDFVDSPSSRESESTLSSTDALRGVVVNASFRGELGNGPGVVREAFQLAATALLCDENRALFRPFGGTAGGVWYHVDPTCAVGDSPLTWRFVGRFLGLCITSGCHVRMPLVPWLWDQLLHGADGGLARSRDGYVPGFVDPTDRFVGEKLGEVADRVVVASGGAVSDRDARIATELDELPAISRIKAAKERHERRGGTTDARWLRDNSTGTSPGNGADLEFEPEEEEEEEEDRATYLRALERVLSISPGPHGDAAALRWLDAMAEVEPEFHRSLLDLLRHPIASERNAWAVNMLTFTRDASDDDDAGDDENRREPTRTVELIPGGADVEVTDANKARYVAALARHRATTARGASTLRAVRLMREGLDDVVPLSALRAFSPDDLRRLVCGVDELCPGEWRSATRHTDFGAWSASASVQGGVAGDGGPGGNGGAGGEPAIVGWFWRCVRRLDAKRRRALLQFWTGASTLGPTGFAGCEFRLTLARHLGPESLPESQTCSRTIKLAEYRSFEQLRRKLMMALDFGAAGFAFA